MIFRIVFTNITILINHYYILVLCPCQSLRRSVCLVLSVEWRAGLRRPTLKKDGLSMLASEPASTVDPDAAEQVIHLSESRTTVGGDQSRTLRSPVRTHPAHHRLARARGRAGGRGRPPARRSARPRQAIGPTAGPQGRAAVKLDQEQGPALPGGSHDGPAGKGTNAGHSAFPKLTARTALREFARTRGTGLCPT